MPSLFRRAIAGVMLAVLLVIQAAAYPYPDLDDRYGYAYAAIDEVYRLGIMQGSSSAEGRLFRPDSYLERQEFFRIVFSMNHAGRTDVGAFYERQLEYIDLVDLDEIAPWARGYAGYNLVNRFFIGNTFGELRPRSPLTYLECAIVLLRILGYSSDALSKRPNETLPQWQERLLRYAEDNGLFAGLPYERSVSALAAKSVSRADVAVLIYNAVHADMVTFIQSPDGEGVYLPSSRSLLEHSYGQVWDQSSIAVALALPYEGAPAELAEGYVLADGTVLPLLNAGMVDTSLLGRTVTYTCATNNPLVSWAGVGKESDEVLTVPAEQLRFVLSGDGSVTLHAGERVLAFAAEEAESLSVYFFDDRATKGSTLSLSKLADEMYPYSLYAGNTPVRLVFGGEGTLQSVMILPLPLLYGRR